MALHVPLTGSYSSALLRLLALSGVPLATSTLPLGSNAAVCCKRAVMRLPVALHVPLARVTPVITTLCRQNLIRGTPLLDLPLPAYSFIPRVNPTLTKLKALPKLRYNPIWPPGTKQPLTKDFADYFFSLLSTCETSLLQLLRDHPELPHFNPSITGAVDAPGSPKLGNKHARTKLTS